MMGAMLVGAHAGAGMFTVNLEPDAAKRRAVPISYGTCSAELYLYAPEGWMIGHSSIVAQDSTLWTGPSEYSVRTHLYRMLNANSSREYLVVYGNLTKGEGTDGRSPWFRATVPTVDIDWEGFTSVPDEENEDDRCLFCPVTSDNAKRRRMVIQNPRDDTSLKDPILTLVYSMSALTVRRADGTAVASGTALDTRLSINHTPLTLYADPVAGKDGFRIMLKGPSDGTYEPMDFIWGNSIAADLDVDANRNGVINEADDDTEESVGGTVGVGGALQPLNLKLLPEDLASGTLTLSAESGGARIRIWPNSSTNGTPVALPKNWTVGADTVPDTLYVQGVAASDNPRDVALKLSYTDGQKTVEDAVRLTVVQTDLDVDADYNGAITEADEPLEESAGGLVAAGGNLCPVSLKLRPESLALGTLTLSAEPGGEKIRVWPTASTNGTPVTLPKTWTVGADTVPDTLYVQGLSASGTPRDVKLRLLYKSGALDVCEDSIRLTVLKVDMNYDLWWFNGENPGDGYHITSTLTVTPVTTGTFKWDVITGTDKVNLNNGGTDADSIMATDDNTIDVKSTAASAGAVSVTKDVTIQLKYNGAVMCTCDLAVFSPDHLVHLRDDDAADATWGYDSKIHYRIEDQFNRTLPYNVPLNEHFTLAPTTNYAGMDWRRGAEGSVTVNPVDWYDHIQGETSTHTPTPVGPTDPDAGTKVYYWPGTWNIGSTTIGNGVTVGSSHWAGSPACIWQKYRGYADHE